MKKLLKNRNKNAESGVALLIAMIALLLISGVAVAMIVASGSEGALNGNYRSSSSAYYAALAGIEEGRGRMLATNPATIVGVGAIPASLTAPMLATSVQYIVNPNTAAGETTGSVMTTYPDNEYIQEFQVAPAPLFPPIASTSSQNASNIQGPMYKWVRINPVTEKSINADVDGDGLPNDALTPLYYDSGLTPPAIVVPPTLAPGVPNPQPSQNQVFEVTALAVLPNGSEKLLQYLVAPQTYNFNFNSPLTLAGTVGTFVGASSNPYQVNGNDGSGNPPPVPGCNPNTGAKDAISVSNGTGQTTVINGIPANRTRNYTGASSAPDVAVIPPTGAFNSTASLDQLLNNVRTNADVTIPNPPNPPNYNNSGTTYNFGQSGSGYTWPSDMSASNPKTVYVDGSFDLGPNTGYGLLVVTGNFRYQGNSGWKGIILVIGNGTTTFIGNGGGNGSFDGAIFVASTRDSSGNQLANFGPVNFDISGGGGNGIYYNSCWIKQANQPPTYKVLSFKEIQYTVN